MDLVQHLAAYTAAEFNRPYALGRVAFSVRVTAIVVRAVIATVSGGNSDRTVESGSPTIRIVTGVHSNKDSGNYGPSR